MRFERKRVVGQIENSDAVSFSTAPDVLVLGGGVAGLTAAMSARRSGCSVAVLQKAKGATAMSSGAVDVATVLNSVVNEGWFRPFRQREVFADAVDELAMRIPGHPYARIGAEGRQRLPEALSLFREMTAEIGMTARDDGANMVLATQLGTFKPVAMCPESLALDFSTLQAGDHIGLLDIEDAGGYDMESAGAMMQWTFKEANPGITISIIRVPAVFSKLGPAESAGALATRLTSEEDQAALDSAVQEAVKGAQLDLTHLLLPPILGTAPNLERWRSLNEKLGVRTFEVLSLPPSAPGRRLIASLESAATRAGVTLTQGVALSGKFDRSDLVEVKAQVGGQEHILKPRSVILASGRFLSGGMKKEGMGQETIFGLPIESDGSWIDDAFIGSLTGGKPMERHPIFRAGVSFDVELRPQLASRRYAAKNLFAAGSILGGYDPAKDGSSMGVAILTGYLAGKRAGEEFGGINAS
jgi:glycerol-3-phosphate dehydrogenase subunit B